MVVFVYGKDQARIVARRSIYRAAHFIEARCALHYLPAVIFTPCAGMRLIINLLDPTLAHIPYPQITGFTVKAEAPGITQAINPDIIQKIAVIDKGIVRRDCACIG